jgi:hypothetical protein
MDELNILLKETGWPDLLETISRMVGAAGKGESDDLGNRHVWCLFGITLIAIAEPGLEDDQGIAFSTFTSQLDLVLRDREHTREAEVLREAFAILLVLRLRSLIDPGAILVRNLQKEIVIQC